MIVAFDLEADCLFSECAGADRGQKMQGMGVTVACAIRMPLDSCGGTGGEALRDSRNSVLFCDDEEFPEPLLRQFDDALVIVAYNGLDFDMPLLKRYYKDKKRYHRHLCKVVDPFSRIRSTLGIWPKLDLLLEANDLATKTADGKEAVAMWRRGEREKLAAYCMADVAALVQLAFLPKLKVPGHRPLPELVYGVRPALAAAVFALEAAEPRTEKKRPRARAARG